ERERAIEDWSRFLFRVDFSPFPQSPACKIKRHTSSLFLATMTSQYDLARQLKKWAVEEMKFQQHAMYTGDQLPTQDDFLRLCRGSTVEIWKFLINNISSLDTVRVVKGNLAINDHHYRQQQQQSNENNSDRSDVMQALRNEREELMEELKKLEEDNRLVESEIDRLERSVTDLEMNIESDRNKLLECQKSQFLISTYNQQSQDYSSQLKNFGQTIDKFVQSKNFAQNSISREKYASNTTDSGYGQDQLRLESICERDIRRVSKDVQKLLELLYINEDKLDENYFNNEIEMQQQHIWTRLEDIMCKYSPSEINTALSVLIENTCTAVQNLTAKIDLKKDADELKFKFDNSQLKDLTSPPNLLQSARKLIAECAQLHINTFISTEELLCKAHEAENELNILKSQLYKLIEEHYYHDSACFDVARSLLDHELEIIAAQEIRNVIKSSLEDSHVLIQEQESKRKGLLAKYHNIQRFNKLTQSKQELIQALVKENSAAKNGNYSKCRVLPHEEEIIKAVNRSVDKVIKETNQFNAVQLSRLQTTFAEELNIRLKVDDLSIYRLNYSENVALSRLLHLMEFPQYLSSECLLPFLIGSKKEGVRISNTLDLQRRIADQIGVEANLLLEAQSLSNTIKEYDENLMKRLIPLLRNRNNQAKKSISDCATVKEMAADWWEQPAQYTVPWVKYQGRSLLQWLDEWRVTVNLLQK
ncbi:AUGMIN subunit 5, partial [Trichoplax sp. H2]